MCGFWMGWLVCAPQGQSLTVSRKWPALGAACAAGSARLQVSSRRNTWLMHRRHLHSAGRGSGRKSTGVCSQVGCRRRGRGKNRGHGLGLWLSERAGPLTLEASLGRPGGMATLGELTPSWGSPASRRESWQMKDLALNNRNVSEEQHVIRKSY